MKKFVSVGLFCAFASLLETGCSKSDSKPEPDPEKLGTLAVPLVTYGPSGTQYRLRNARFDISRYSYYGYDAGGPIVVNSDDDLDAASIEVDLEEGNYYIYLESGWRIESVTNGEAVPVQATLLSPQYQWINVYRHSTSWVSFQFGIGDQSIWLNGKVNIGINVYEDPDDYYGPSADAGVY